MKSCVGVALAAAFSLASAVGACAQDQGLDLLRALSDAAGPPGFEEAVRRIVVERMGPFADEITYDGLGSVIGRQGASGPRVMIDAHMDELGGVLRRVTPDGFVTMQMLGGWLDQALPGQRWTIIGSKGPVLAVSNIRDIHLAGAEERTRPIAREAVFLDIGAKTAEEVRALGVEPGDPVVPDSAFAVLNGTRNYVGKAFDDRVGLAVMLEAMRRLKRLAHANTLLYAATVQEEVGLRGAQTAAAAARPDVAIAIEGGVTGDTHDTHPEDSQAALGAGPGLFLFDGSALPNRRFVALVREVAAAQRIPLQLDLVAGYGDDSAVIQRNGAGAPTVNLVVPVRYTHVHNGVMNRNDFDQMVDLVVAVIQRLDGPTVARLRDFTPER